MKLNDRFWRNTWGGTRKGWNPKRVNLEGVKLRRGETPFLYIRFIYYIYGYLLRAIKDISQWKYPDHIFKKKICKFYIKKHVDPYICAEIKDWIKIFMDWRVVRNMKRELEEKLEEKMEEKLEKKKLKDRLIRRNNFMFFRKK